jgi:hypothetical protein
MIRARPGVYMRSARRTAAGTPQTVRSPPEQGGCDFYEGKEKS